MKEYQKHFLEGGWFLLLIGIINGMMFMLVDLRSMTDVGAPEWMWGTLAFGALLVIAGCLFVSGLQFYIGIKEYLEDDRDE